MPISLLGLAVMLIGMIPAIGADMRFANGTPWHDRLVEIGFVMVLFGLAEIIAGKIPVAYGFWRRFTVVLFFGGILGLFGGFVVVNADFLLIPPAVMLVYFFTQKPNRPHTPISWDFAGFVRRVKKIFSPLFRPDPPEPPRDY